MEGNERLGDVATVKGAATVSEAHELLELLENYSNQTDYLSNAV